ncbi:FABP family protein [Streptomyces sp. NPDC046215]|uniref:Peroxynitrite isomerase n=1 Tax=Streptomyces stramineus TaxID=173861 RepID=A0ABN0ZG54_9ACTN
MSRPFPDTHDAHGDPALHPWLLPAKAFVGVWRGRGRGAYPTLTEGFAYEQEISVSHDGRPFLHYEANAWLIDEDGAPLRPSGRETGWIRVAPDGYLEALLSHPTGISEIYTGKITGAVIEMTTTEVIRTPLAKEVTSGRRRYTLDGGFLSYEHETAAVGQPLAQHLSARLGQVKPGA